jgi:diguanylate cyclase (GGDEF)-like protein
MGAFLAGARFNGWTVGLRLLLINGLLALALVFGGIIAWRALSAQSRAMSGLALISKGARYHQDAETQLADLRAAINAALAGQAHTDAERKDLLTSMDEYSRDLHGDLLTLAKLDLPPDLMDTESRVQTLADAYLGNAGEIGRLATRNPTLAAALLPQFDVSASAINDAMDAQTEAFTTHIVKANDDASAAEADAKRWLVMAGVLINIIVGVLVVLLSRSIRRSLKSVRDVAQALASGNLHARNVNPGSDELGELGRAINGMADSLDELIGRLRADAEREAFANQLGEGLDMADSEEEAFETLSRAMVEIAPDLPIELLLADSSRAHLERATAHPLAGPAGCNVESPFSCMAVRRGSPVSFEDGEAVNACTRLRGRSCGPVSAVCVPISFMGRALGVLHAAAPVGKLPSPLQIAHLTTLGAQAGARIGTVRAFNSTQHKAATDSLTGLHNRRSAEERARDLVAMGRPFAVVIADLDHFKKLNDSRGHEAGDKALRLFAETLRQCMRDGDMASRWGGEEFVLILRGTDANEAAEAVERIRAALATALLTGGTAAFTSSFGIADSTMSPRFDRMMKIADEALYRAKEAGRDRAVIGDARLATTGEFRRAVEHTSSVSLRKLAEG